MTVNEARAIVEQWFAIQQEGRVDRVAEVVASSYVRHEPTGTRTETIDETRRRVGAFAQLGWEFTLHDIAAQGDKAWIRWTGSGPDPESREPRSIAALQVYRVADGKIVEAWWASLPDGVTWEG